MSYIDDLTYRVLSDGYGNAFPVRKKIKFAGSNLIDDNKNDQTIVTVTAAGSSTLEQVCNVGNAAYSTITHLYDPTDPLDAVNLQTLEAAVNALTLSEVLANGNTTAGRHINMTSGSYLFSTDGYVSINSTANLNDHRIFGVATPIYGSDAVNKDYVDSHYLAGLTLGQVMTNGNIASTTLDMNGFEIQDTSHITFGQVVNNPKITQTPISIGSGTAGATLTLQAQGNGSTPGMYGGNLELLGGDGWIDGYVTLGGKTIYVDSANIVFKDKHVNQSIYLSQTSDSIGADFMLQAQSTTHGTGTGGNLVFMPGNGLLVDGLIKFKAATTTPGSGINNLNIGYGQIFFDTAVATPTITQVAASAVGTCTPFQIAAQSNAFDAGMIGGDLYLSAGNGDTKGSVFLQGLSIKLTSDTLIFEKDYTPIIKQEDTTAANAKNLVIQPQSSTFATGIGGDLLLYPGAGNSRDGYIKCKLPNGDDNIIISSNAYGTTIVSSYNELLLGTDNIDFISKYVSGCYGSIIVNKTTDVVDLGFRSATVFPVNHTGVDNTYPNIRMEARDGSQILNIGELQFGKNSAPTAVISMKESGIAAMKLDGGIILKEQSVLLTDIPTDGHSLVTYQSRTIATANNSSTYTVVPAIGVNQASNAYLKTDKHMGGFDLTNNSSKALTFSKFIHGKMPLANQQLLGKFLLGWVGNDGGFISAGAAIEFLFGVFLDGSQNVYRYYTSLKTSPPSIYGPTNGFTSISSETASANSGLIPDMPGIVISSSSSDTFTITISTTNNSGSTAKFFWTCEYSGQFEE